LSDLLLVYVASLGALLLGAGLLHALPRLGPLGRRLADACCRAPALDLVITYFTILPPVVGSAAGGWAGLLVAIAAQISCVLIWTPLHEMSHPEARKGPRIVHVINGKVGRVRNHTAVWVTALAVPVFWIVRVAELVVYAPLPALVRFPKYRQGEWVNVSRQKFDGLVGHDLIWCLYCDWMTGVWSLGSEMLRNVESFWCPIRFASDKKCANCAVDFPDVERGWVPAEADMAAVAETLDTKYDRGGVNAWFGHPVRLTVGGEARPDPTDDRAAQPSRAGSEATAGSTTDLAPREETAPPSPERRTG